MNLGFLGLQFALGLQQGNLGPILSYLGATEASLPALQLAGPLTGLIIQPIIGAMSDRTVSRLGRRTPYFLIGALLLGLGLFAMPFSTSLFMAASLLWLLDGGANIAMEPYRAYVSDRLDADQRAAGFLSQSAMTGLAQMLAFLTPSFLVYGLGIDKDAANAHHIPDIVHISFMIGIAMVGATILSSVIRVPELPLTGEERAIIAGKSRTIRATVLEIRDAIREMPQVMRQLGVMMLVQWYGMWLYWSYVIYSIGRSVYGTAIANSSGFHAAVLTNGEMAAFYNGVAFVAAFAMVPFTKRFGPKAVHAACLLLGGLGMMALPHIQDKLLLFVPAVGIGLAWASIMGNPYVILAEAIPPERTGVYMGIFNMTIVIPMLLIAATLPFYYRPLLGGDPRNVLTLAGALFVCAAVAVLLIEGAPKSAVAANKQELPVLPVAQDTAAHH